MNFDDFTKPSLIEPGIQYFLNETLKKCREFRNSYYNWMVNIGLFIGFMTILGAILLYKYKGKLTPSEKVVREREKQQYILSKIKNFQDAKRIAQQELITGLPHWNNEYDNLYTKNPY